MTGTALTKCFTAHNGRLRRGCAQRSPKTRTRCSVSFPNPIGVHSQVWTGTWDRDSAERAIRGTKDAGYDMIELALAEPETVDPSFTKSLLEEHGVEASGSLGLNFNADISSEDAERVERGKDLLLRAVEVLHKCGGLVLSGVTYSAMGKYDNPPTQQNWKNSVNAMKEVTAKAADLGVTIGLEVINRYETNLLNTAEQGMEMVADIGAPNVMLHMDSYHMNIEEDSMQSAIRTCASKLGYVHIGESHRGYLGSGSVDFKGLFEALASVGYTGPIVFESFSSEVVSPSLSNALSVWRNLWDDSEDLASHARNFIYAELGAATIKSLRQPNMHA